MKQAVACLREALAGGVVGDERQVAPLGEPPSAEEEPSVVTATSAEGAGVRLIALDYGLFRLFSIISI